MPVADFPGQRGWGYDGVLLYAPEASYGTPDELKRLVAAAHAARPDGAARRRLQPLRSRRQLPARLRRRSSSTSKCHTPWGAAINFDGEHSRTVRDFFIHNALYWVEEFHFDGLRVDAVHAMHDQSQLHFVDELAQALRAGPGRERPGASGAGERRQRRRSVWRATAHGRPLLADAQWNDDVHHALHVMASGETDGYYARLRGRAAAPVRARAGRGLRLPGRAIGLSRWRRPRGTPSAHLPPLAFVNSLQTHDQVGNRAFGERIAMLSATAGRDDALRALHRLRAAGAVAADAVHGRGVRGGNAVPVLLRLRGRSGRGRDRRPARRVRPLRALLPTRRCAMRIPDPNAAATFIGSKLDWARARARSAQRLAGALQRPAAPPPAPAWCPGWPARAAARSTCRPPARLRITWPLADGRRWHLLAQLADQAGAPLAGALAGDTVYASHASSSALAPWSVRVTLEQP